MSRYHRRMQRRSLALALALFGMGGCDAGPPDAMDARIPGSDAPTDDVPGLDVPGLDVPGLDAPGLDARSLDASIPTGSGCEPLPAPTGTIVNVDPSMAAALPGLVREAAAGTTFVLADGTYRIPGDEAARRIQIRASGVTLRSASGNASAVIIDGEYVTSEVITVHADDVTIAEVTVTHAVDHGIHVTPFDGEGDITGFRLLGARLTDCGEQFLKVNPGGARDGFVDGGEVACSHFEMTDDGRPHVERAVGGCYTGGIDVHSARGWLVRDSRFVDIYCAGEGLAEHAIHFWVGARDTIVERNTILNCARGIGFGLVEDGVTRAYADDPYPGLFIGHYDGIIRNNVIVADIPYYDTGIELAQARGTLVAHNSIAETTGATATFSSIDSRFRNAMTTVRNNLVRRITVRDEAMSAADHNVENVPLDHFEDAAGGDLHLTAGASMAIDVGVPIPGIDEDFEGDARDAMPDLGADER